MCHLLRCSAIVAFSLASAPVRAGELNVTSVAPGPNALTAPAGTAIRVTFDAAVDRETVTPDSFWAFGRWSGPAPGTISFADDDHTIVLEPTAAFSSGEHVTVAVSHDVAAAAGAPLRDGGYTFQFWTRAMAPGGAFTEIQSLTTNGKGESSQPYGGIGSDLDNDGWLDVAIVNEVTEDLRVFLNAADGSGVLDTYLEPTPPLNSFASPSEPADFDRDGNVDMCVSNQGSNTVSVLLGHGDGGFDASEISVGGLPNGIAVLDADGDGDVDIANCNNTSSSLSYLENNGDGTFAPAVFFDTGFPAERALAAADMDGDGILDLVVGTRSDPTSRVIVMRGNGDGTFTFLSSTDVTGTIWMLVVGDVNGDGHVDVTFVSGAFNDYDQGAIMLGDGQGSLDPASYYPVDHWPVASDLGDLDGDGDLDWVTASFGGDWAVFLNDGAGTFTFEREFNAPAAASCSLAMDLDNDRDLDLALIDETADVLITYRNGGTTPAGDVNADGVIDFDDLLLVLAAWGDCGSCPEDLNDDGTVNFDDLLLVLSNWS